MIEIWFEWDEDKNLINQRKHCISFEEAAQVFNDPLHIPDKTGLKAENIAGKH